MKNENLSAERLKFIKPSAIRRMIDLSAGMKDVIHLEQGEPDFITPKHILDAAKKAMDEGYTHYTQTQGMLELREAVSEKLSRENGIDVDPKTEVVIVSGTQETMAIAALAFLNPGDRALVLEPYYPAYFEDTLIAGAVPVPVPLNEEENYRVNQEELEKRIDSRTKLIWICSPSNPTGHVFTREDLEIIVEVAKKHDLLIFSDEIYEKLTYDNAKHISIGSLPGAEDRTITVNGFSKAYAMTGWRIGYAAAKGALAREINKLHYYLVLCPSSVAQKAALAALTGPQDCVEKMRQEYERRRKAVLKELEKLPGISYVRPKGAFYVFPDFSRWGKNDENLAKELLNKTHVCTAPGSGFGESGRGHLRISYSAPYEQVVTGISRIVETLQEK
ncbi:MAG: pyridoxal phosphate-dependent aminotransferase [Candidatus Hadarchaeum sp.]|uniref:pyridoxal phosphate-dependent aminotransferase n=3 Tax=Candidatus Hadarchaeum sp. TaxID=2883567 RepID=UPI003171F2EF